MGGMVFERSVRVPVPVERLWDWHAGPGAFERLAPPWQRMVPVRLPERLAAGAVAEFLLAAGPARVRWRARLGPVEPPYRFVDTQETGPFAAWRHEHRMRAEGEAAATLTDRVEFRLPGGLGKIPAARRRALRELERLFRFRHARMAEDLRRWGTHPPGAGRTVLVSGITGLIGSRLAPYLRTLGFTVRGLTRGAAGPGLFRWDPARGWVDPAALDGVQAVIHLAGENIAAGRWTAARRARILASRLEGTRTLVEAMRALPRPPDVLACASGVNYYASGVGERDELAPAGDGFLSVVCRQWEAEALRARQAGVRVVCLRIGVVLDPAGGALAKLLPVFCCGMGGPIGHGRQGLPWIGMDDLLDIYAAAISDAAISGPVNAVHPQQVTQRAFARTLGRVLGRPARLPLPAPVVGALFGQMGRETLLADLRVRPGVLLERGHAFRDASLETALAFLLGRELPGPTETPAASGQAFHL